MIPSISVMICSTIILIITYSYLLYIEKKVFIGIWAVGWSINLIAQIITLITIIEVQNNTLVIISHIIFIISAMFLLLGAYSFLNKTIPAWSVIIIILSIIWLIYSIISKESFLLTTMPSAIVLGISTIWVGVIFLYYEEGPKYLTRILGSCFILWGIHKMDYPFLRNVPFFAIWGYVISAIFSMTITVVFILIYFEKIRAELMGVHKVLIASEKKIVTEGKLLNEAMEFDKLKTEFFANISHELKTPLNVILASTQLIELYNKNHSEVENVKKVDKNLITIKQNVFRLSRLINNLIDITIADAGFFELEIDNYNIVSIIEEVTMSVVDFIENKGISIKFDTDVEEKIMAFDADKMERVMLNLLSNSGKFTKPGGSIMVKVSNGEEFIAISVKDTGIGIAKDKQEMIFERFRQVDKSLSRNNEGSGIGLSLVKSLVELHKGTITIESEYGLGSEFIIRLPITKVDEGLVHTRGQDFSTAKIDIEFSDLQS